MYLSGKSALDYWGVTGIRGMIEPKEIDFIPEYVIFTKEAIYRPQRTQIHTCSILEAEKYTTKGVCNLELVFLQLAKDYSIHKLIYLGLQLCSYQASSPPLCDINKLFSCANKLKGHRGRRKALRAIRYIRSGSRSPMESVLYMFLTLPNALGGCAFPGLEFNKKIYVSSKDYYYADIYSSKKKLIIEYDSYQNHNNPSSFSRDNIRASKLESKKYKVISVKPLQLYDLEHYQVLVQNISRKIGKRIRIRARKFFDSFTALRDILSNKGRGVRTRIKKIKLDEVPRFSGVLKTYPLYNDFYKKTSLLNKGIRIPWLQYSGYG